MYKEVKQFNVNVFYNASWCLFNMEANREEEQDVEMEDNSDNNSEGEEDNEEKQVRRKERKKYAPYRFSGKSYSFDMHHEKAVLDHMRVWANSYFSKSSVIHSGMYSLLRDIKEEQSQLNETKEFDLLCKVLKIFEKDEHSFEVRIKDVSQVMWFMTIPKHKFPNMSQGEIVRIRSVEVNLTTNRNVIQIKPSTNIMRICPQAKVVQELLRTIEDETNQDKLMIDDYSEVIMSPEIITDVNNCEVSKQIFRLNDIFLQFDKIPEEIRRKNLFKVRFYVLRVDPFDVREMVQALCPSCKETFSCQNLGTEGKGYCKDCKEECSLIYRVQFLVKDQSS
mmetsp:Transcript_12948/g.12829  ORF Transcript_12948/g.12829 Transcript_12948/m.12829 type:complete len:336 (+) Transcript_12948:363-1370(+)